MALDSELSIKQNREDKKASEQKMSTIYSTEKIDKILKDKGRGLQADMTPFFHGDREWKDAGILFEYTPEEIAELEKCASDPTYFIENYCKFLNDKGRTLVTLRDYQKDIIKTLGEEEYDEELDLMVPKNRQVVLLQSRQSGKCVQYQSVVETKNGKIEIGKLYKEKFSFFNSIKKFLYWLYKKL